MSGVTVVGFIYSFKNLKVLWSLFTNAVKYVACGQIFYSVFNVYPLRLVPVRCHSNQLSRHQETRCLCDFLFFTELYDIFLGKTVYSILPQSTLLQKWVPSVNKAVLRACAIYAASCSGISHVGLKWFPCVQAC